MLYKVHGKYTKKFKLYENMSLEDFLKANANESKADLDTAELKNYQRYKLDYFISGDIQTAADNKSKIISRDTLAINLNNIAYQFKTIKDLKEKIRNVLGYYDFYVYSTFNDLRFGRRAAIVIPLETSVENAEYYNRTVAFFKKQMVAEKIIAKFDKIGDAFHHPDPLPTKVDDGFLKKHIKGHQLNIETEQFQNQINILAAAGVAPKDALTNGMQVIGADKLSTKDLIRRFAETHADWLYDVQNYISCELALKRAERRSELTHDEALEAVRTLANHNFEWEGNNIKHYEALNVSDMALSKGKGLDYFFTQANLATDSEFDWLSIDERGNGIVDMPRLSQQLIKQYHFQISGAIRPTGAALYLDDVWILQDAKLKMRKLINQKLDAASPVISWSRKLSDEVWARVSQDATSLKATTDFSNNIFDQPSKYAVQFRNGTLYLQDWHFGENKPENHLTSIVPYDFPNKEHYIDPSPVVKWMTKLFNDDHQAALLISAFIGMAFTQAYPYPIWIMLLGNGANGKSTLLNFIRSLFRNSDIAQISLSDLGKQNNQFALSAAYHKHLAISSENSDAYLKASDLIKIMTGNEATARIEFKGQNAFQARLYAGLIAASNDLPSLKDHSQGMLRRLAAIRMDQHFSNDSSFDIHQFDKYIPSYIKLCLRLFYLTMFAPEKERHNYFELSKPMKDAVKAWDAQSDNVRTFYEDYCLFSQDPQHGERVRDLYAIYQKSTLEMGNKPLSRSKFVDNLLRVTHQDQSAYARFRMGGDKPAMRIKHVCFTRETIELLKDNATSNRYDVLRLPDYSRPNCRFLAGEQEPVTQ